MISVATSADGYIDDLTPDRLILSSAEDWAEVYRLRAAADAIVIGAQTLRADNPRLSLKSDALRQERLARATTAEPFKVIISGNGEIDPSLRIFSSPYKNIIIFSNIPRPELDGLCEVIVAQRITAEFIVTELEKRSLFNIFIEGGAKLLSMMLNSQCVDSLRIAINPAVEVACEAAPRFVRPKYLDDLTPTVRDMGGMRIEEYTLKEPLRERDIELLARAIEISHQCQPSPNSYCVGAVVRTLSGDIFEGYTHETSPTHHAEQEAIKKAEAAGAELAGATIYSSMEPCSQRASEPESCSQIIIRHRMGRALFALYEPNCFVCCQGALNMRMAGIDVLCVSSMAEGAKRANGHLFSE